jgi:hypothetical protein
VLLEQADENNEEVDEYDNQLTRILPFFHTNRIKARDKVKLEKRIYVSYSPENDNENSTIKQ